MTRTNIIAFCLAALALTGCNVAEDEVRQVQTNVVDKTIFEGEWWFSETVVDVDADAAALGFVFNGQMASGDDGINIYGGSPTNFQGAFSVARIRWVIDQDYLYAYRAYELVSGGNDDGRDPDFRGQPVAAFRIEKHFDIRRTYSTVTGEETNVVGENTTDRRWYEREFIRVDWSENLITSFLNGALEAIPGGWRVEPAPFFFQDNTHQDSAGGISFPETWHPQFVTVGEDPNYRFADEWPADQQDTVHYMSFVTQSLLSPGINCLMYSIPCQTAAITMRNSFLRVPPNHNYAAMRQTHEEFDRFGLFRTYQRTYVRGGRDNNDLHRACTTDADCATDGGTCDGDTGYCTGGLTDDHGETDFLVFYRPMYNMWTDGLTDQTCRADWECATDGSFCDPSAQRCTTPMADRTVRQVAYYLNAGYPEYLAKDAYEIVGVWNETFMRGNRAVQRRAVPDYSVARVTCQEDDPTTYCYCGAPEVGDDNTCAGRYDPFISPDTYASNGVADPYDCYINNTADWAEPARPTSFEEYEGAYNHEFVGSECILVLRTNSCDLDDTQACEDLGDLRYQFFNYVNHGNVMFGGVAVPLVDPTSGEFISSNANMGGESVESVATRAMEYWPVLRCANPTLGCAEGEEGADERYITGENMREYFSNLGRTERPVALAPAGRLANEADDNSRPGLPVGGLGRAIQEHVGSRLPRIEQMRGAEGRLNIMSDRMRNLAGTEFERQFVAGFGEGGLDLLDAAHDRRRLPTDASALDEARLDEISPFRGRWIDQVNEEREMWDQLGARGYDPPFDLQFRSTHWEYFAEAFRGRSTAEQSIRARQMVLRMIMFHEVGHAVGLRHNFGGSFDRNNYYDAYYNIALDLPIPNIDDYDDPRLGGNADGFTGGEEVNRYLADLREVRQQRALRGSGNTMSSSIMDYHGDLSDTIYGIGRYDTAATIWSYFGQIEQFESGDPYNSSDDSNDGLALSDRTPRTWWTYYAGGESCTVDTDCPYNSASGLLADGQVVSQRCIRNPRYSRLPQPCGDGEEGTRACICSPIDEDLKDYVDGVAYLAPGESPAYSPVNYLFCTDDRTQDISWCSRFDAGESFQEAVDNFRRSWTEGYPSRYFRRFRRYGARPGASVGGILSALKIYQHLFFRLYYEPGFGSNEGPLGFIDQFMASVDAMNWFTEIVNLPDVGSYEFDAEQNLYRHISEEVGAPGSDVDLTLGQGYATWSRYQEGLNGFFRVEQAGTFFDKYYALYGLAERDWGLPYTVDDRYYINFYDLFEIEMTEFFGGMVQNNPRWYAPRLRVEDGEPVIENLSWYRGTTLGECRRGGVRYPCRGPQEEVYSGPAIVGTSNDFLRRWATTLALAFFPVFYDTTYEQRLMIFKAGNGDGFTLPETQPDGTATCAYGTVGLEDTHDTGCDADDADYVVYVSDRFHTPYVAQVVRSRITYNLPEEQTGFQMLRGMVDNQNRIAELEALASPTAAEASELANRQRQLLENESFLELLIDLQRRFGISSWF